MSTPALSRHQLIRGNTSATVVRPPWAVDEDSFIEDCTRCFSCAKACPSHLIVKGMGGYPELSFTRHGCDFCEACVRACPESVLHIEEGAINIPWQQQAVISDACFSRRGIICRSCGEICESRAIRFKPSLGGRSQIEIEAASCTGCGECVHVCPAHAIEIEKISLNPLSLNQLSRGETHE